MVGSSQALPSWNDEAHLRYDTPVSVGILSVAALSVDGCRGLGFRLWMTRDDGVERGEEIHRW